MKGILLHSFFPFFVIESFLYYNYYCVGLSVDSNTDEQPLLSRVHVLKLWIEYTDSLSLEYVSHNSSRKEKKPLFL